MVKPSYWVCVAASAALLLGTACDASRQSGRDVLSVVPLEWTPTSLVQVESQAQKWEVNRNRRGESVGDEQPKCGEECRPSEKDCEWPCTCLRANTRKPFNPPFINEMIPEQTGVKTGYLYECQKMIKKWMPPLRDKK